MLPGIGIMVGFYIVTRMASFLTRRGDRAESVVVKVLAVVTAVVAILTVADLFMRATEP